MFKYVLKSDNIFCFKMNWFRSSVYGIGTRKQGIKNVFCKNILDFSDKTAYKFITDYRHKKVIRGLENANSGSS